jgi:DNA-binding beta-propeller fold protein YncE
VNYDYEGTNRNINVGLSTLAARLAADPLNPPDPNLFPGTADVSAPDSPEGEQGAGYLWDSALRAGLSLRNYGFFLDLTRYSPLTGPFRIPLLRDPFTAGLQVAYPTKAALQGVTDPYYRGFDTAFPDFYRVNEWLREFDQFEQNGGLPQLEFVRIMEDHTGSFSTALDGVNTPEIQTADNDYALGRIIDAVSHSKRYKDNTLIFVIEDDAQDGPDHLDAHRSIAFVAGAYVKRGAVISKRLTTVSMVATMVDILGIEHLGLYDANAEPMSDCFQTYASNWAFDAIIPDILKTSTTLPLPGQVRKAIPGQSLFAQYSKPLHNAAWWANQTRGFDFSSEDRVNAAVYNRILWKGILGDARPYPAVRSGADLRHHREQLLSEYRKKLEARQFGATSGRAVGGG